MQTANTKPDKVTSTIKAIGAGVFLCVPLLWAFGMMAKDHPVPAEVQGCYMNGPQTLEVQGTRIIVNRNAAPEVNVRYMNTNAGRQIETVNGSWLELDQYQPPHKQVGRNMVIRVQNNALVALTRDAEPIPFARVTASTCHAVRNWPRPA